MRIDRSLSERNNPYNMKNRYSFPLRPEENSYGEIGKTIPNHFATLSVHRKRV